MAVHSPPPIIAPASAHAAKRSATQPANHAAAGSAWSLGQRRLHWVVAVLLVALVALGVYVNRLPLNHVDKRWLLNLHQLLGVLVLTLGVLRLWWRRQRPRPVYPQRLPGWELVLAAVVQGGLYVLLIVLPLLGLLLSFSDPFVWPGFGAGEPVSDRRANLIEWLHQGHYLGAWLLVGLVIVHVGGVLRHGLGHTATAWRGRMRWRR